jgi:hypothetical protein
MKWINTDLIVECLTELASREVQMRLWLSAGQPETSSFSEVVEQLFSDSGLGDALEDRDTGFGDRIEGSLMELSRELDAVDRRLSPQSLIDHPTMNLVRALAAQTLASIQEQRSSGT